MAALAGQLRQVRPGRLVAAIICSLFYGLGWCVAASWLALAWAVVAVKTGYQDALAGTGKAGGG